MRMGGEVNHAAALLLSKTALIKICGVGTERRTQV
jgi:hypothetical protein